MSLNKNNLTLIGILIFFSMAMLLWKTLSPKKEPYFLNSNPAQVRIPDRAQVELIIGEKRIKVEVVNTPSSITQGLSGRSAIGSEGMLFMFAEKRVPQFWMKEMQFDLDLVWISDNKIVGITKNVPHPSPETPLAELPLYAPPEAVNWVLEIPAGKANEWLLQQGDRVEFPSGTR